MDRFYIALFWSYCPLNVLLHSPIHTHTLVVKATFQGLWKLESMAPTVALNNSSPTVLCIDKAMLRSRKLCNCTFFSQFHLGSIFSKLYIINQWQAATCSHRRACSDGVESQFTQNLKVNWFKLHFFSHFNLRFFFVAKMHLGSCSCLPQTYVHTVLVHIYISNTCVTG